MKTSTGLLLAAAVQGLLLAGCVPAVMAPTVQATAGPGKTPTDFAADYSACTTQANQQIAAQKQAANNQIVGTVLTADMTTATAQSQSNTAALQQQLDVAYSACMYARGETVPGYGASVVEDEPVSDEPHYRRPRRPAPKPAETTSAGGFVEPSPSAAPAASSGFAEPAPAPAASGGFAEPAPAKP